MAGPTLAIREQCPLATPTNDGLMSMQQAAQVESSAAATGGTAPLSVVTYTNVTRPAAGAVGAIPGTSIAMIWNDSDKAPNFSDGLNWYDAVGNLT